MADTDLSGVRVDVHDELPVDEGVAQRHPRVLVVREVEPVELPIAIVAVDLGARARTGST